MSTTVSAARTVEALQELPPSSFGLSGAIARLAVGKAGAIGIGLATTPVLTRLYTPDNFGTLAILSTLAAVLAPSATLSYVRALPLVPKDSGRRELVVLCASILLCGTVVAAFAAFGFSRLLPGMYGVPELAGYVFVLPLIFMIGGAEQIITTLLNCERKYRILAGRDVIASAAAATVGILAGFSFLGGSTAGLLIGTVSGMLVGTIFSGSNAVTQVLLCPAKPLTGKSVYEVAVAHCRFPLLANWGSTLSPVTQGLPVLLLGVFFPIEVVGFYAIANRLITLPMTLFGAASSQAYYIESADAVRSCGSANKPTLDLLHVLSLLTTYPLLVSALLAPALFEILLGIPWREAGVYTQILAPWIAVGALASPLTGLYAIKHRLGEFLAMQVLFLVGRAAALIYGGMILGSAISTLVLFSLVGVAVNLFIIWRCTSLANISRRNAAALILKRLVEALLFLLPAGCASFLYRSDAATLLLGAAATVAYFGLIFTRYRLPLQRFVSPFFQRAAASCDYR
ncbi:MAG: oligosaccharide flippase family protein [Pirellulaceae bacterium]